MLTYHNIVFRMNLQNENIVSLFDSFAYTTQDYNQIRKFDFIEGETKGEKEKVRIEETYCTLVIIGGKFLEKKTFYKVIMKIDEIRNIIRKYLIIYRVFPKKSLILVLKAHFRGLNGGRKL